MASRSLAVAMVLCTAGAMPTLAAARRGARLRAFLDSCRSFSALPRRAHAPSFRLEPVQAEKYRKSYQWIMDGKQKIGLVNLAVKEIEMFRFFTPQGGAVVEHTMPEVHHWATLRGPRIVLATQTPRAKAARISYGTMGGKTLELLYREDFGGKSTSTRRFVLRYDPVIGYVWDCAVEMTMERPQRVEYSNLLAGGLSESRPDHKKYQKCIWTRRDGKLAFMYQNPLSMMHSHGPEWADLEPGGFIGWVAEADMNPFLEVIESAPPTTMATCSQWYDQHIIARPPRDRGRDGLYHLRAAYRLLSLPLPVAKELEDAAREMLPARGRGALGFLQGFVNDFEEPIPPGVLYIGAMWCNNTHWDRTVGHSGTASIKVTGGRAARPIGGGTAIYLESRKRYRLSAWVKTKGVAGKGACLRVAEVFWNWNDIRASHDSAKMTRDNAWTKLEVVLDPAPGDPFGVPTLCVEGEDTAWFDDLELVEIPR